MKIPVIEYYTPVIEYYTPKIHESGHLVEVLIRSEKCPICGKVMIERSKPDIFPLYYKINQEAQAERAGLVFKSKTVVDDENICEECEKAGAATFLCELCGERKPTDKIEERVGSPAEFLCSDCYESVPAKRWQEALDELYEAHRYDFE